MRKVLGIVDLHHDVQLDELTQNRSIASTGLLGRYCFIDIPFSNFANSGIEKIGVLIKDKPRSLFRHLGLSNPWSFNTKTGGITLLYNEKYANSKVYNTNINNLLENYWFLKDNQHIKNIVITSSHVVMTIDYNDVIKQHRESNADITVIYKHNKDGKTKFLSCRELSFNEQGRVSKINENKGNNAENNVSLLTYVINRDVLINLIEKAKITSSLYAIRDLVKLSLKSLDVMAYEYEGFVQCYDSLSSYLNNSLELLDMNNYKQIFRANWPIYTRTFDTPPVKYGKNADASKSLIANGSVINGKVDNSIVSRDVVIEEGAEVRNSILMSRVRICKGASLDGVIVDKEALVKHVTKLNGSREKPICIKQEDII